MTEEPQENRFERNRKAVYAVAFSLAGLVQLGLALLTIKLVRDEVNRGFERYLVMRDPWLSSNLAKSLPKNLFAVADGLENKQYHLRVDENGFIVPSAVHEKTDASVVFLGGSTTECHFMNEEERFPYLVGRQLEVSLGKRGNSCNTGYAGNNTRHCLLLLQGKVLPKKPRAVVLMECINSLTFLKILGGYWNSHAARGILLDKQYNPIKNWIFRNLIGHKGVSAILDDEFQGQDLKPAALDSAELAAQYRKNFELFAFICPQHKIVPILMTQFTRFTETLPPNLELQLAPIRQRWGSTYAQYRALNNAMRAVAREQNVQLIDPDRLVPKTNDYMYDVVHLNATGSRFVAEVVSKSLDPVLR